MVLVTSSRFEFSKRKRRIHQSGVEGSSEIGSARRTNRWYLREHLKRRKEIDAAIVRLKRYVREEEMEKAKRKRAKNKTRRRVPA